MTSQAKPLKRARSPVTTLSHPPIAHHPAKRVRGGGGSEQGNQFYSRTFVASYGHACADDIPALYNHLAHVSSTQHKMHSMGFDESTSIIHVVWEWTVPVRIRLTSFQFSTLADPTILKKPPGQSIAAWIEHNVARLASCSHHAHIDSPSSSSASAADVHSFSHELPSSITDCMLPSSSNAHDTSPDVSSETKENNTTRMQSEIDELRASSKTQIDGCKRAEIKAAKWKSKYEVLEMEKNHKARQLHVSRHHGMQLQKTADLSAAEAKRLALQLTSAQKELTTCRQTVAVQAALLKKAQDLAVANKKQYDSQLIQPKPLTCGVCMDKPLSTRFDPCGHVFCCTECAAKLSRTCPMCRGHILHVQTIFFS